MKNNLDYFSKAKNLRHIVIDHSVVIEEFVSETIAKLLNIKIENSKSLGFGSGSLSFNQKILMIEDFVGINSEISKKITAFTIIRNKFAHLRYINSWNDFFAISQSYDRIKKQFMKWYGDDISELKTERVINDYAYFYLTVDILQALVEIQSEFEAKKRASKQDEITLNDYHFFLESKLKKVLNIENLEAYYYENRYHWTS